MHHCELQREHSYGFIEQGEPGLRLIVVIISDRTQTEITVCIFGYEDQHSA